MCGSEKVRALTPRTLVILVLGVNIMLCDCFTVSIADDTEQINNEGED